MTGKGNRHHARHLAIILASIVLSGLFMLSGCQQVQTKSPFALVDEYMGYIWLCEKEAFLKSVDSRGLDTTLRELPYPLSFWVTEVNGYGSRTPKGVLSFNEYLEFCEKAASITNDLRELANSFPAKAEAESFVSEAGELRHWTGSPFVLVDEYMANLWPREKEAFLKSVKTKGLEATLCELSYPQWLWGSEINIYGSRTPKGTLDDEEYYENYHKTSLITYDLRKLANSYRPDGQKDDFPLLVIAE